MPSLTEIPGIAVTSLELLEAAGFRDCESLAKAGLEPLAREIERANAILKIADSPPTADEIAGWIRAARSRIGEADVDPLRESVMPVDFESLPEVAAMLKQAACAIPFPGRWLAESGLKVSDISPGILLNRCNGDLEICVEDRIATAKSLPKAVSNQYVQISEKPQAARLNIDLDKLKSAEEFAVATRGLRHRHRRADGASAGTPPTDASPPSDDWESTTPSGHSPKSRRSIRGVLHTDPWSVRAGAVLTLVLLAIIALAVTTAPLLLLSDRDPEVYHWVRPWWIVFPFLLPIVALAWLIWGFPCSCRICRQKLFVPKQHRKNAKAHHLPLVGYILPLILHLLVFQWFRCTHCGTPVRLKK